MVSTPCTYCPHLDAFHGNCSHPSRQAIVRELASDGTECPVFAEVRAGVMRNLERHLHEGSEL